jgi:hypothetical protein
MINKALELFRGEPMHVKVPPVSSADDVIRLFRESNCCLLVQLYVSVTSLDRNVYLWQVVSDNGVSFKAGCE